MPETIGNTEVIGETTLNGVSNFKIHLPKIFQEGLNNSTEHSNDNPNNTLNGSRPENNKNENESDQRPPSPLREQPDVDQIYRTISQESSIRPTPTKLHKMSKSFSLESPKIISNPLSFFNRNDDTKEMRFESEQEEEEAKKLFNPMQAKSNGVSSNDLDGVDPLDEQEKNKVKDKDHKDKAKDKDTRIPFQHSQTLANLGNFLPHRFSARPQTQQDSLHPNAYEMNDLFHPTTELSTQQKLKMRLSRLTRRRPKERRRTSIALGELEELREEGERQAGERAQKLIVGLALGGPAIGLMASCLLEDEKGIARAPLLLSLLGLKVTDISLNDQTRIRRFRIDLEYGVGPQRMKWSIERNAKDLFYLHYKFNLERWAKEVVGGKIQKPPKFPIPPLRKESNRTRRNKPVSNHRQQHTSPTHEAASVEDNSSLHSMNTFRAVLRRARSHLSISSVSSDEDTPEVIEVRRKHKNAQYIHDVERYLNELIEQISLKPESNRLFMFFEISPISSLLSYESGYIGKQGQVHITSSSKSSGWRVGYFNADGLKGIIDRRSEKWMLIRDSYVMYVSDFNSTIPLDVFLVDSDFKITYKHNEDVNDEEFSFDESSLAREKVLSETNAFFPHLKITLENGERKLAINPKSSNDHRVWIESLMSMKNSTVWSEKHRFESFAPVRENCFAQWYVDGRDYFWSVSSALEMAKDVIYIHDWWLTPEIYLRRPANGNQQWRLDRILQRKAQQGVKIFVIVYRNVGSTVSIDSLYTKHSILSLNEDNIHVIRSPNQLLQNTYFWAHHEKLCIIDNTIAFMGGIDMCYGRYDTPDHVLTDDSKIDFDSLRPGDRPTRDELINFQTFPGKDYSNPRVRDFSNLEKPYQTLYDRNTTPRMPWHDIHMFTSGKVARDLSRHFVQRWNYLLRQKRPSRFTPLLTPPSDLTDEETRKFGLDGTCEIQLLRSSGNWSLGLKQHEQSIQNAYIKLIESSQHFVYIENQFFVTSCFIEGIEIRNRIGDALVDRIIRAHKEGTNWKAVIIIPLMPGFQSQVDEAEGSAVRVIMQCQYMSISRGESSIFAKLRKKGIDPDNYIQFFSLRKWGRIGTNRTLVTEQLYIHAKAMVVDDRTAIIGSANINERSMRGVRDSEIAAIVQDKEQVNTMMNGEPFKAGKFAHTLRMRLMREHLGVDVDILDVVERRFKRFEKVARSKEGLLFATNKFKDIENRYLSAMVEIASRDILGEHDGTGRWFHFMDMIGSEYKKLSVPFEEEEDDDLPPPLFLPVSLNNRTGTHEANRGIRDRKKHSYDNRVQNSAAHKKDVYGEGLDKYRSKLAKNSRLNSAKFLRELAMTSMDENPTTSFMPDIQSVREFLEADDCEMTDEMDEESEKIINERNRERWLLLKKISYLQRIASKEQAATEKENKRRQEVGLSPLTNSSPTASDETAFPFQKSVSPEVRTSSDATGASMPVFNGIQVTSLDENTTKEVIKSITSPDVKLSSFVDPYVFEDPIDGEFYECLWNEIARRNTEIYRRVFHTQPDDMVSRWSEYTHYTQLHSSFMKAQDYEADLRQANNLLDDEEALTKVETAVNLQAEDATETMETDNDIGLLGKVPPSRDAAEVPPPEHKMRLRLGRRNSQFPVPSNEVGDMSVVDEPIREEIPDNVSELSPVQESDESPNHEVDTSETEGQQGEKSEQNKPAATSTKAPGRRPRAGTYLARRRINTGEAIYDRKTAERLLNEIHGNLVYFPTEWLGVELISNNWFYNTDRLPPMEIYD
ncbi:SPO14 [[Candida] subhashii]|uniref:Phospholipase D1 n=1 Tax=[Candida] subhashii TaxID=561895 RepID=A0A8J5QJ36_9ASCO|nr:SPO14 [[Candida] subhashii]KAG7663028.1 SPO14 [[Candida] subhashii]